MKEESLSDKRKIIEEKLKYFLADGIVKDIMERIVFQDKEAVRKFIESLHQNERKENIIRKLKKRFGDKLVK